MTSRVFHFVNVWILFVFSQLKPGAQCTNPPDEINQQMLQWHNDARTKILNCLVEGQPPAVQMPNLTFDPNLAEKAQQWANNCTFGHDDKNDRRVDPYPYVGQNFGAASSFITAFNLWFDEHTGYNFEQHQCSKNSCGHYTQVVWSGTTHLGCAYKECPKTDAFPWGKDIICNYGPGGNYQGQRPYEVNRNHKCMATTTTSTTITTTSTVTNTTIISSSKAPSTTTEITSDQTSASTKEPSSTHTDSTTSGSFTDFATITTDVGHTSIRVGKLLVGLISLFITFVISE